MADDAGATGEPVMVLHPAPPLRTEDGMRVATDLLDSDVVEIESDVLEAAEDNADGAAAPPSTDTRSALWRATQLGLAVVVALAVLVGWLGFRAYQSDQERAHRSPGRSGRRRRQSDRRLSRQIRLEQSFSQPPSPSARAIRSR